MHLVHLVKGVFLADVSTLSTLSVRVTSGLGYSRKPHGVKSYSAPVILILGYHPFNREATS